MTGKDHAWDDEKFMTPDECKKEYPILWEETKNIFPKGTEESLAKIVTLVLMTCYSCHSAGIGCKCWDK
jgi:hypothetical protein